MCITLEGKKDKKNALDFLQGIKASLEVSLSYLSSIFKSQCAEMT